MTSLLRSSDRSGAIDALANSPGLLAEAAAALPAIRAVALRPAGEDGVRRVIGARFGLFPQPDRSAGEWALWWRDYVNACGGLSEASLESAMQLWIGRPDAEFLPKPGRLSELARSAPNRYAEMCARISAATRLAQDRVAEGRPRATREQVAAMMAEFRSRSTAGTSPRPHRESMPAADPAEHDAQVRRQQDFEAAVVDWAHKDFASREVRDGAKEEIRAVMLRQRDEAFARMRRILSGEGGSPQEHAA